MDLIGSNWAPRVLLYMYMFSRNWTLEPGAADGGRRRRDSGCKVQGAGWGKCAGGEGGLGGWGRVGGWRLLRGGKEGKKGTVGGHVLLGSAGAGVWLVRSVGR